MPSFLQWVAAGKPKKYRIFVIHGEDATLRADALDQVLRVSDPQEKSFFSVGEDPPAQIWDAVTTQPMPGIKRRLVVVRHADRMRLSVADKSRRQPLRDFIDGSSVYPETTLVLILDRPSLGKRVRNKQKSLPGSPVWETSYEDWEQWLRDYSSAGIITCSPLSADQPDRSKASAAQRWLSLRLPVTQGQTEYLWRRVGGSSLLARDTVRTMRLIGVVDATGLAQSDFVGYVDQIVGTHGADDFVEHLLFERRADAFASVADQDFDVSDWRKIVGLLGQRLDWLGGLNGALATSEKLDQVMRRLNIPRHLILHYAHREDVRYNIARKYDGRRVSRCRQLLAEFDAALGSSLGVPPGFGEALVAAW